MKTEIKEINLLNDAMFKSLMTNKNNREMVVDFLHAITGIEKEVLASATFIGGEEIPKKRIKEKNQTTDVTIRISDKHKIIVEMNQSKTINIFEKNSLYAFSRIVESTEKNIINYPKIILINIDNFNYYQSKRAIIEFKMRDLEGNIETELYQSIHLVLDNILNSSYNVDEEIKNFARFLKTKDIEKLENDFRKEEKYMAAVRTIKDLSSDPEFEGYYDREEMHRLEKEGMREEGAKEQAIEIAKHLLELSNITLEQIAKATNLSIEEVNKLKDA